MENRDLKSIVDQQIQPIYREDRETVKVGITKELNV